MGYYAITNLINRKDNMSKEIRNTIDTITHLDSLKVVKVALGLSEANQNSTSKVMEVVSLLDKNLKSLAIKVMELEKKLEAYERPKN